MAGFVGGDISEQRHYVKAHHDVGRLKGKASSEFDELRGVGDVVRCVAEEYW